MKRNQKFTKEQILDRVDQFQVVYGCDRQRAFTILRDQHPDLWEALGRIFADEPAQAA